MIHRSSASALLAAIFAVSATAQCEPRWMSAGAAPGVTGVATAVIPWNIGPSGEPSLLIAGSLGSTGGDAGPNTVLWDGFEWNSTMPWAPAFLNTCRAVMWDADAAGPAPALPHLSGDAVGVWYPGQTMWRGISAFNGHSMLDMATWDPDGTGPQAPLLMVGGAFSFPVEDGQVRKIASWNGTRVGRFAEGFNNTVRTILAWDPEEESPVAQELYVGGIFTNSGGLPMSGVARWNGENWETTGAPASTQCDSLVRWDPDGDGAEAPMIVAVGQFPGLGPLAIRQGEEWAAFPSPLTSAITATLTTFDHDGDPATASRLIVYGISVAAGPVVGNILMWDGTAWSIPGGERLDNRVRGVVTVPPSAIAGPSPALVCVGDFIGTPTRRLNRAAVLRDGRWRPLGDGFSAPVNTAVAFDPDGAGPIGTLLLAGGDFLGVGDHAGPHFASFENGRWTNTVGASTMKVGAMTVWDPDASGPRAPGILATLYGDRQTIRFRDGATWSGMSNGLSLFESTQSLFAISDDGTGRAMVGGGFSQQTIINASRWNGASWISVGQFNEEIRRFLLVDLDGPGPSAIRSLRLVERISRTITRSHDGTARPGPPREPDSRAASTTSRSATWMAMVRCGRRSSLRDG